MRVLLYTDESALRHHTGTGHPERPARIPAVIEGVMTSGLEVERRVPPEADRDHLHLVHDPQYVRAIERFCMAGGGALDADTAAGEESWEAALRAAGAGSAAAGALQRGEGDAAFVVMRPPGHHALHRRAMGFCLFNNIAVTAAWLSVSGAKVAIVDWDVHHGNGTQDTFYHRSDVLYVSVHEFPAYPGTGWVDEFGTAQAAGATINVPLPPGTEGRAVRTAFDRVVLPVVDQFGPDWVLVSAGYDAHAADPLADFRLVESDYEAMGAGVATVAPEARLVFFLEGGYDLTALTASTAATLRGAAKAEWSGPGSGSPGEGPAWRILDYVADVASHFWAVD